MKPTYLILLLIAVVVLSIRATAYAQEEHVIVLEVNTAEITKPNIDPYCSFEGQDPDVSDEDFTIVVHNGDTIRWVGISTSSDDDVVNITSINYRGGKNVLGKNVHRGDGSEVAATVKNAEVGDEEKYTISFKVLNNGRNRNGTFLIDPKIRIH